MTVNPDRREKAVTKRNVTQCPYQFARTGTDGNNAEQAYTLFAGIFREKQLKLDLGMTAELARTLQ